MYLPRTLAAPPAEIDNEKSAVCWNIEDTLSGARGCNPSSGRLSFQDLELLLFTDIL